MRQLRLIIAALLVISPFAANADPIILGSHIDNPDVIQDFGVNLFPNSTIITNQFTGLTFNNVKYSGNFGGVFDGVTGGFLFRNSSSSSIVDSILFDSAVSGASFAHRVSATVVVSYTALLAGSALEQFSLIPGNTGFATPRIFGFDNIVFDEIRISYNVNAGMGLDDIRFRTAAVPEPGTLALFTLGLLGLGFARKRAA